MTGMLGRLVGEKKESRRMEARAAGLPADYRTVYDAMKGYMFYFTAGDGMDVVALLRDILDRFEDAAAEGLGVLEVTGADVAAFCDGLLPPYGVHRARLRSKLSDAVADIGH